MMRWAFLFLAFSATPSVAQHDGMDHSKMTVEELSMMGHHIPTTEERQFNATWLETFKAVEASGAAPAAKKRAWEALAAASIARKSGNRKAFDAAIRRARKSAKP